MDSLVLEKLNGGLLYLYNAATKKEFYSHLEGFVAELFQNLRFSVVLRGMGEDDLVVECCAGREVPEVYRSVLSSDFLAQVLRDGLDLPRVDDPAARLDLEGEDLPIRAVRVIRLDEDVVGLLVFHDEIRTLDGDDVADLEDYVFDHVLSAFQHVASREALLEGLEASDARLQAISEMGELLGQLDLAMLLSHLIAVYTRLTEAQVGSVVLEEALAPDVEWGLPRSVLDKIRERGGPTVMARVLETAKPVFVRDFGQDPRYEPITECNIETFLCVPLLAKGRVVGVVNLVNVAVSKVVLFTGTDKSALMTMSSLAAIAIENAILHRDLIEKEGIKANLQIARSIQRGMYPVEALRIPGYETAWLARSCDETGGDYFDFLALSADQAAFVVGDVSGHGIGAALLMATGRATLRALLSVKPDLKDVMDRLNDLLSRDMEADKFMTLFLGCLDHRRQQVSFVNAGHDPPNLFQCQESRVLDLSSTGLPLGIMPGFAYETGPTHTLLPGDALLLTTDGVWEATNPAGERFGKDRLRRALARHAHVPAEAMVDAILKEVEVYTQGVIHPDDLTLVVLKRVS